VGRKAKGAVQVAPKRKEIANDSSPYSGIGKLGFGAPWEYRLNELADYRKIHGHCNVPTSYSENTKLATWVGKQRQQYKLHLKGKKSQMILPRIQKLESLGFRWRVYTPTWEDRLSELAEYREIHGHCNVPARRSEDTELGRWVENQRHRYNLKLNGKTSPMTPFRIQKLECLGFEWKSLRGRSKWKPKKPSVDDDATCVRKRAVEAPEHVETTVRKQEDFNTTTAAAASQPMNSGTRNTGF
jgi:hypothetical protein